MSRLMILVSILIALLAVQVPAIDAARQATPAVASVATQDNGEMLDLPAMILQPADLVAVGLGEGFGIFGGNLFALDEAAELSALNRGDDSASRVAEITATLEDAGFRQGYSLDIAIPTDTPVGVGLQVTSEIVEYTDTAGAAAGFAYATDTFEVAEVAGARRFGDESTTQQWSGGDSATGTAFQAFGGHARVGRLVLYIAIIGPADQPPELAVAEALMERLLERVAHEARPARGELAYLVARLGGEEVEMDYDFYSRLDGVTVPYFGDTAETLASRELFASRDTYVLGQWVAAGGGGAEDDLRYEIGLYRLDSPKLAAAWLDGYLLGLTDFPVVVDMPPLGDLAITYRDEKDRGNGIQATGFATYLRTGNDVLILIVNAVPGIDQAGYEELVLRNVDCLRSGFCLDPVSVPQDLISRGEIATPEAGSSGAQPTPSVEGVGAAAIDAAGQATPAAASPTARDSGEELDLPAMVLLPADLVAVGLGEGFGIYGGNLAALGEAAEITSFARGDVSGERKAEFTTVLEDARFRQGYYLDMYIPADTPVGVGMGVHSGVDEYIDAAGAAAGFAFFADMTELVDVELEEVAAARRFGEESMTWRGSAVDLAGDPYQLLGIDARIGRLALYVAIYDYANQPPEIAVAEALMKRLLARVEREARPARGELAYLVPRLGDAGVVTNYDNYERLNGVNVPLYGDTAETLASREEGVLAVRDKYYVEQSVPAGGDGTQDDVRYNATLYRFASADEAAAWLGGLLLGSADYPVVADMPPLGEQGITFHRDFDRGEGMAASGMVTYLLSGTVVLRLAVSAVPGIERAGYEELLARNVACLRSGFCLEPIPMPQDLVTGGMLATPEAASPAAPATPSGEGPATVPEATPQTASGEAS